VLHVRIHPGYQGIGEVSEVARAAKEQLFSIVHETPHGQISGIWASTNGVGPGFGETFLA
jgi:hypothetical protein